MNSKEVRAVIKVFDNLSLPLAVFDTCGRHVYSNQAFTRLFDNPPVFFQAFFNKGSRPRTGNVLHRRLLYTWTDGVRMMVSAVCIPVDGAGFNGYVITSKNCAGCIAGTFETGNKNGIQRVADRLTGREYHVLSYLRSGHTVGEISQILSISDNTVKTHIKKIYRKLGVQNRVQLLHRLFVEELNDS